MSASDVSTPSPTPVGLEPAPRTDAARTAAVTFWTRLALVCAVLLTSAAVRGWQSRRIERDLLAVRRRPPIDLARLPLTLGPWNGTPTVIDPAIARGTGADQIVTRRYVNQETGVALELIVLYGPAVEMYIHAPERCYPNAGFTQVDGPEIRRITTASESVPFRSLVYSKGEAARPELQEVYYTWWYNGRWTPDVGLQKHFERIPSMYKVHLARRVAPGEKRDAENPSEAFLQRLLPEMDRRMSSPSSSSSRPS